jgi:integrase
MRKLPNLNLAMEPTAPIKVERGKHRGTVNLRDYLTLPKPERGAINYFDKAGAPWFGLLGLGLRVYASGKRTWFISFYNKAGTKRRFTIGRADRLDYQDAREEAQDKLADATKGNDPVEKRKAERAEQERKRSGVDSFEGLCEQYIKRYAIGAGGEANPDKRSWKDDQRRIEKYLVPAWGKLDSQAVTRKHVRTLLDKITDAGHPVESNRVHALIRKIFNWAIRRDLIVGDNPTNPATNHDVNTETPNKRFLSEDEIRVIWCDMSVKLESGLNKWPENVRDLFQIGLLTGQRLKSLSGLQWSEIDFANGWLTIPARRMKQKKKSEHDHRVPVVGLVAEILERRYKAKDRDAKFVFPSRVAKAHLTVISEATELLRAVLRKEFPEAAADAGYVDPTFNTLRHTFSTLLHGTSSSLHDTVERIMDHAVGSTVSRVYNVADYYDEKRAALMRWDDKVRQIAELPREVVIEGRFTQKVA